MSDISSALTGNYTVVVTNEVTSVESDPAVLQLVEWAVIDGTYQGLLLHDNSATPEESPYPGRLTVKLTKTGRLSAKLEYRGLTHTFSGKLAPELILEQTIVRKKNQSPLSLRLQFDPSELQLVARVSEPVGPGIFASDTTMKLHRFDTKQNPAPQVGSYTARFNAAPGSGGPTAPGYALVSISKSGAVKATGKLPDGTITTFGALVGADGSVACYDPLYKLAHPYAGHLAGPISIDQAGGLLAVSGSVEWNKPPQTSGVLWKTGLRQIRQVEGSAYIHPGRGQRALETTAADGATTFESFGTNLFTNALHLTTANRFVVDVPDTKKLSLKLQTNSGFVSGSFYDPVLRKARKLSGVLLQAQAEFNGFYLHDTDAGEWFAAPTQ